MGPLDLSWVWGYKVSWPKKKRLHTENFASLVQKQKQKQNPNLRAGPNGFVKQQQQQQQQQFHKWEQILYT